MGKKILLPTDFSKCSWNAIKYAVKLYENSRCEFYFLNTYVKYIFGHDDISLLDPDGTFNRLSENRSIDGLSDILKRISKIDNNVDHRFYALSRDSIFLDAVKDVVESQEIDIIFMGAKGISLGNEGKYGKNTLAAIANIRQCPVLIVPENVTFDRPEEIVLTTNFNSDLEFLGIEHLAYIARLSKAKIKVLSISDSTVLNAKQNKNKILLRRHFEGVDLSFHLLPNEKMPTAITRLLDFDQTMMISYVDKKPSLWVRLGFGKPSLGKMDYYENVPILALRG